MSSELNDIMKELKGSQNDLDYSIRFLSREHPHLSEERQSTNRLIATNQKVIKEIYFYLERLFRIANAHRVQMTSLYDSIMLIPEVQVNEKLQMEIKARFESVAKDTQS
jgi:hypothetical protein